MKLDKFQFSLLVEIILEVPGEPDAERLTKFSFSTEVQNLQTSTVLLGASWSKGAQGFWPLP